MLLAIVVCGSGKGVLLWFLAVGVAAGAALGSAEAADLHVALTGRIDTADSLTIVLTEDARLDGDRSLAVARVSDLSGRSHLVEASVDEDPRNLLCGSVLRVSGWMNEVDASEYNWSKGVSAALEVRELYDVDRDGRFGSIGGMRSRVIDVFSELGGSQSGILQAVVCGWRVSIEKSGEYDRYKVIGLAHIIAVSGSHLAIVAMFAQYAAMLFGVPARPRIFGVAALSLCYLLFSGFSISAARAACMVVISSTSLVARRRSSSLNALAICVILFLVLDPKASASVSFQLSAGATFGIVVFLPLILSWFEGLGSRITSLVIEPYALTLASNVVILPYSAALFSQLSIIAPIANVIAAPLFTVGCIAGFAAAVLVCAVPVLSAAWVAIASLCICPMQLICELLSGAAFAAISFSAPGEIMLLLAAVLVIALYQVWPTRRQIAMLLAYAGFAASLFLLMAVLPAHLRDEILLLDVGQGDAIVVRSKGATMMIDTGNNRAKLMDALSRNGLLRIDALAITHSDDDHCGALKDLSQVVAIDRLLFASVIKGCSCANCSELLEEGRGLRTEPSLHFLPYGSTMEVGSFAVRVVWPKTLSEEGGNADSLCLLIEHLPSGLSVLCVGDAEAEVLERIAESESLDGVNVLKVGHHGSQGSINRQVAQELHPDIALISVGEGNRYGHPHADTLSALEDCDSKVFRTDVSGDVSLLFSDESVRVDVERQDDAG